MSVRRVVVAIIFRDSIKGKEFLVLHRKLIWKGWEFPKGGVERSDLTEEHALRREIKEETCLENIRVLGKLPYEISYKYPEAYRDKYKHTETVQSVYLVKALSGDVRTSIEHDRHRWLPYEKARQLLTHTGQRKALDVAWKTLKEIKLL